MRSPLLLLLALSVLGSAQDAPLKDLDGYFPWNPAPSPEAWTQRAEEVRMQMRVALGLWPEPTRTPLNAVVHGRIERDDYAVEKVFFEPMPGFFATGSLFRPKIITGKVPAVLCPHGHWQDARWALRGDAEVQKEIAAGGERFAQGGRSVHQSLGVQLARMGCVALVIDMFGNCDSQQLSHELAHKFAKQRPEMISPVPGAWGFYSPQAESHAQSIMGLQTWMNIRALDFLTALPEVDPARLACTGASGGGTQTMILGALDPRLAVAAPAVMVSTAMQGGCTCENASLLRLGTGNIEFAALFAPKPMGLTSAKDWTLELPTKGFPELQKHWAMLGAPAAVKLWHHPEFGHNYNLVAREHIYAFFNEHLRLGLPPERLRERDHEPLTREQLSVWDDAHPAPSGGPDFEKKLLRWWHDDAQRQITKDLAAFRRIAAPAVTVLFGRPESARPGGAQPKPVVLLVNPAAQAFPSHPALDLRPVALPRDHFTGPAPRVKNPREAAAYTHGYNPSTVAVNARHLLAAITETRATGARLALVALTPQDSAVAAAAAAVAGPEVAALILDSGGFRFQNVRDLGDPMFLPAGAKYGDLPGLLALGAPRKLFLMGEGAVPPDLITAAYETAGVPDTLRTSQERDLAAAAAWLVEALK
jgi:dienelactone hydrolase